MIPDRPAGSFDDTTFDAWMRSHFRGTGTQYLTAVGARVRRLTREQVVRLADHLLAEALLMPRPGEPTGTESGTESAPSGRN